ncbi:quinone-dependent dihydroorotate dehydrogenase, partial [Candidatus Nomurabacteria bacterium]|nr:quinone-dependent dihydroorotate dehydrogenase [Candidatus Nomurabacteria bacterium]
SPFFKFVTKSLFSYINEKYLAQEVCGIHFSNPIGLSAGFDKDANLQNILPSVGFGFMQIGSVTLHPYEGNPKPRLYRLPKSKALVVYYGLKNIGVKKIAQKLKGFRDKNFPVSISIAKTNSKDTCTTEEGCTDYKGCLEHLVENNIGDFYTINISCPNTFGGEPFTTPEKLDALLKGLRKIDIEKPLFVKMPINLVWEDFRKLLNVIVEYQCDGVIIGNLNKDHSSDLIKDKIPDGVKGGISGLPTKELSNNLISKTYSEYRDKLVIVGVGGVFSAEDAYEKIKLGASLVQLITGMIYKGPQLVGEINRDLVSFLKRDGYANLAEAVGEFHRKK